MTTQDQILRYIRSKVSRAYFEEIRNAVPIAFKKAHDASLSLVNTSRDRYRSQGRYYFLQDGLADLVTSWSPEVKSTNPPGEFYTLMTAANVKVTAAVKPWKKKIRPAKYRINNSKLNKFLSAPQLDLLDQKDKNLIPEETLNAIIIPLSPPAHMDPAAPLSIIIAVPYFNSCVDYHVWFELDKFISGYETDEETQVEVDDGVWPIVRQRMRRDEDGQADNE